MERPYLSHYFKIFCWDSGKTRKTSKDKRRPVTDLKTGPSEYEAPVVRTQKRRDHKFKLSL